MTELADHPSPPADRRDRWVYVWWGVGLALLLALGVFCPFFLRPYLQVRGATGRAAGSRDALVSAEEARLLGTPDEAAAKLGFYSRLPGWIAPHREYAAHLLGWCGPAAVPHLMRSLGDRNAEVRLQAVYAFYEIGDSQAASLLSKLAEEDQDERVRKAAQSVIEELRTKQAASPGGG